MVCCAIASLLIDFREGLGLRELKLVVHNVVRLCWHTPLHFLLTIPAEPFWRESLAPLMRLNGTVGVPTSSNISVYLYVVQLSIRRFNL